MYSASMLCDDVDRALHSFCTTRLNSPCLFYNGSITHLFWLNSFFYLFYLPERASSITCNLGSGNTWSGLTSRLCSITSLFWLKSLLSLTSLSTQVLSNHPCQFLGHIIFLLYLFLLHQSLWNLLISLYLTNPISTIASLVPRPTTMTNLSGRPLLLLYCNLKCLQNCLRNM